jgi:hypothetical protein
MVQAGRDAQPTRSLLLFDPFLTTDRRILAALHEATLANLHLISPSTRQRRMKARDKANVKAMMATVQANLARAFTKGIEPPSVGVSFKVSKRALTRYDRPGFRGLPQVLEALAKTDMLTIAKSSRKGTASTITATPFLWGVFKRIRFTPEHFKLVEGGETIRLSRVTKRDYVTDERHRELIDYAETPETKRYREELGRINRMLANADMRMEPDKRSLVVTSLRQLCRHFNLPPNAPEGTERFDHGGRLFGGWWMDLPKGRRHLIRIDGEPVADLDYASMFLRLAFLAADETPPDGNLYASVPGLTEARWRQGVKVTVLSMLYRTSPLRRLPKDAIGLLPEGMTGTQARTAILQAFPALAGIFETGIGLRLMFREAQTLIAAMLDLAERGVPCLPMHDGLMVASSKASIAAQALEDAAERTLGFRLPVVRKAVYSEP